LTSNTDTAYVKSLRELGLNGPQARTYLALLKFGISTVSQLAAASKADRPDTYRATSDLLKLGLIEKVISKPAMFKPLAFADAVHILIRCKLKENADLFASTEQLIQNFREEPKSETRKDGNQFVIIPNIEASELKLISLFKTAKESVSIMVSRKRILRWMLVNYEEVLKALKRNLTIRILCESSDQE